MNSSMPRMLSIFYEGNYLNKYTKTEFHIFGKVVQKSLSSLLLVCLFVSDFELIKI